MAIKFDKKQLRIKYEEYVEKSYNLQFCAPAESDYYAHEAKKVLLKLLLFDPIKDEQSFSLAH